MLHFKASVLAIGLLCFVCVKSEHEKFWSEPQFFASLTDYLTGGVKPQGAVASEIIPRYAKPHPQMDAVASASNAHAQSSYWKDFDYGARPVFKQQRPLPQVLIARPRPLPAEDSFPAQEVLAFTVTSSERPMTKNAPLIAYPVQEPRPQALVQPHPLFSQPLPHPNALPGEKPKRRRPNGRRNRKRTTTTTPTPTTTTEPPTTTTPNEYDDDYGYDEYDDYVETTPTTFVSGTAPTSSSYQQQQYLVTPSSVNYQPRPQIIVPQYQQQPRILSQGSNSVGVVVRKPESSEIKPATTAQSQSSGFSAQLAEAVKNPFAYASENENDVDGTKPGLVNRINEVLETTRKLLYFPRGVVDVVDHAVTYAEQNPYVNLVMGTMADTIFGSTATSQSSFVTQKPKSVGINQLLIARPTAPAPTLATVPSLTQLIAQIFPSQPKA